MKNFNRNLAIFSLLAAFAAGSASAQVNKLTATTTNAVVAKADKTISVASATGITSGTINPLVAATQLFVVDPGQITGEVMTVKAVSGTTITVDRVFGSASHVSGAMVLAGLPQWFYKSNPSGSCVTASTAVVPWVNTLTGQQWLCSTSTLSWIPGWGNPLNQTNAQIASSTAYTVPSGAATIASPFLKTDTGTNAATSFVMGVGWNGQGFCVVPGGAWTGTASSNIEKAFTAVANRTLCFAWDATVSAFTPSY